MKILIVEDDPSLRTALCKGFAKLGYAADAATDGEEALELYFSAPYDAVVLDLNLPRLDGLDVLRAIRQEDPDIKVVILSARNAVDDRILGLDGGASDYLGKPFSFRELEARVRALMRRRFAQQETVLRFGPVRVDTATKTAYSEGEAVALSRKEYGILECLCLHRGETMPAARIIAHVWAEDTDTAYNAFKVHLTSLRKKLPGLAIVTVRGQGYYVE